MSESSRSNHPEMMAQDNTPWVRVHELTEFMFCQRAGVIAREESKPDSGDELERAPRLDYLHDYEIELIERDLQKTWNRIWQVLTWASPVVLAIFILSVALDGRWALVLIPLGVWLLRWLRRRVQDILELTRRQTRRSTGRAQGAGPSGDQLPAGELVESAQVRF